MMNILNFNGYSIAYNKHTEPKKKAPFIVFHHGFMSDMEGIKALYTENFCKQRGYNFIRFDNLGCGKSSGRFTDQTISSWLEAANYITKNLESDKILLVGSSLGAWIAVLSALANPSSILGIVTIAAAFDFTEDIMKHHISAEQEHQLNTGGICYIASDKENCSNSYPITANLLQDAKKHLLLTKETITLKCPIHLIHGMSDQDVPYTISQQALQKIDSQDVVLKLIKDGDHRVSRICDLEIICHSIEEIVNKKFNSI